MAPMPTTGRNATAPGQAGTIRSLRVSGSATRLSSSPALIVARRIFRAALEAASAQPARIAGRARRAVLRGCTGRSPSLGTVGKEQPRRHDDGGRGGGNDGLVHCILLARRSGRERGFDVSVVRGVFWPRRRIT